MTRSASDRGYYRPDLRKLKSNIDSPESFKWTLAAAAITITVFITTLIITSLNTYADNTVKTDTEITELPEETDITETNEESEEEIPENTLVIGTSPSYIIFGESRIPNKDIIRILTVEGGDTYLDDIDQYSGWIYTYGTFEVIKSLKGDLEEGQVYKYIIAGGKTTWEKYALGQNPESIEKQEYLHEQTGEPMPEYVIQRIADVPAIQEGSVYFSTIDEGRPLRGGSYTLGTFGEQFRIVDEDTLGTDTILVLNNFTGKWEPADEIVFPEHKPKE